MTGRLLVMTGIALVAVGYVVIEFGRMVLDDKAITREAGEDAAHDAVTAAWLGGLRKPSSEFDEWCEQAIALTREVPEPEAADLAAWESELAEGSAS